MHAVYQGGRRGLLLAVFVLVSVIPAHADQMFVWVNDDPHADFAGSITLADSVCGGFQDVFFLPEHVLISWSFHFPPTPDSFAHQDINSGNWTRVIEAWTIGGAIDEHGNLQSLSFFGAEAGMYVEHLFAYTNTLSHDSFGVYGYPGTYWDAADATAGHWERVPETTASAGLLGFALAGLALIRRLRRGGV